MRIPTIFIFTIVLHYALAISEEHIDEHTDEHEEHQVEEHADEHVHEHSLEHVDERTHEHVDEHEEQHLEEHPDEHADVTTPLFTNTLPSYVDKSLLIKHLFDYNVVLITAPRQFGKSTNVDMLKRFFEITVDKDGQTVTNVETDANGNVIEKSDLTENFRLFKKHNLKIYEDKAFFHKHCGQHPIIFINFKPLNGDHIEGVLESLKTIVHSAFTQHAYLVKSNLWKNNVKLDKKTFEKYLDPEQYKTVNQNELANSFRLLSHVLSAHFNKKTIVLIDDMDKIIFKTINCKFEMKDLLKLVAKMVSELFHNNDCVAKGIIHATLDITNVLMKHAGNMTHLQFLQNHPVADYYGFTEEELTGLLQKHDVQQSVDVLDFWYGGYNIIGTDKRIFNVWSIVNYLKKAKLKPYFTEFLQLKNLDQIFECEYAQFMFDDLLSNRVICIDFHQKAKFPYIQKLKQFVNSPPIGETETERETWLYVRYLFNLGYLNVVDIPTDKTLKEALCLQVPNIEIGTFLANKFYTFKYLKESFQFRSEQIDAYVSALRGLSKSKQSFKDFQESIRQFFFNIRSALPSSEIELHRTLLIFAKHDSDLGQVEGDLFRKYMEDLVIVIARKDGTVIFLRVSYKELMSRECLGKIFEHHEYLIDKYRDEASSMIYIGLTLDGDRKVELSYLVDSTDVKKAVRLSHGY